MKLTSGQVCQVNRESHIDGSGPLGRVVNIMNVIKECPNA